jgi:hypothetical protein
MNSLPANFQDSLSYLSTVTLTQLGLYMPRILLAIGWLVVGIMIAKILRRGVIRILEALRVSDWVKNTPIEHFVQGTETTQKIESLVGSIVYWLVMLVVLQGSISALGLDSISLILQQLLFYIPNILRAILVLFLGLLLAGVAESVVKAFIKSIGGESYRLLGKISSYLVVSLTILIAISELGIAREFIMILFVGFVAMLSLGFGLALGLGGQEVVRKMLGEWYEKTREEIKE